MKLYNFFVSNTEKVFYHKKKSTHDALKLHLLSDKEIRKEVFNIEKSFSPSLFSPHYIQKNTAITDQLSTVFYLTILLNTKSHLHKNVREFGHFPQY